MGVETRKIHTTVVFFQLKSKPLSDASFILGLAGPACPGVCCVYMFRPLQVLFLYPSKDTKKEISNDRTHRRSKCKSYTSNQGSA